MRRLIDADTAFGVLAEYYHHTMPIQYMALKEALDRVPTVEAVPVVQDADGTLHITVKDQSSVNRVMVEEEESKFCGLYYQDAISDEAYQQVVWENAVMAEQLNKIGKGFGEEMGDVVPVVHGMDGGEE